MLLKFKPILFGFAVVLATGCSSEPIADQKQSTPINFNVALSSSTDAVTALDMTVVGRVIEGRDDNDLVTFEQQWPGTYIEAAFTGEDVYFDIGSDGLILVISIDSLPTQKITDAKAGRYIVSGLTDQNHTIRVQVVSENQSASSFIGGIYIGPNATALKPPHRDTQFEFIGDSHTVGYANTSNKRECSRSEVSITTDTSLGIAGQLSKIYNADYQVNAMSGRGIVRNYGGGDGATIPEQYPFALLSASQRYTPNDWSPELVVTSIGTNDFSTDLNEGEQWSSREALTADYEAKYFTFLETVMTRYPESYVIVWVAADETAEKYKAAESVVNKIKQETSENIGFIPVDGLSFNVCHWHPTVDDAEIIVEKMDKFIRENRILPL